MIGFVYKIVCPIKNKPIYVGATITSLRVRQLRHIRDSKNECIWQKIYVYLRENEIYPQLEVIEMVNVDTLKELREIEKSWILKYFDLGYPILNKAGLTTKK